MSDPKTPKTADPATPEPAVPAATSVEPEVIADTRAEPEVVADTRAEPEVVETRDEPPAVPPVAAATTPVVVEKKKRGVGAWSFVLGLLTILVDIAFAVFVVIAVAGAISDFTAGTLEGAPTAIAGAGLVLVALFLLFGGFLSAGVAVLLGLIALVSGRGRVLGIFGLVFGAAALIVRVLLLTGGIISPELG